MVRAITSRLLILILMLACLGTGFLISRMSLSPIPLQQDMTATTTVDSSETVETATPTETIPPSTPLATLTPSRTLLPPPTFEPPTQTMMPSNTPAPTISPTLNTGISIPGLNGAETPTPSTTPGCEPNPDWELTYTVRQGDSIASIAAHYGTYIDALAAGNCITDPSFISVGQVLHVPGEAHPVIPAVECVGWELLTPMNGTMAVEGSGQLTFNWRGPHSARNLIRIHRPNGTTYERVVELRQNERIDLGDLPEGGTYTWYVYPLDYNFVQVCPEGGPWTFTKAWQPTPTPTTEFSGSMPGG